MSRDQSNSRNRRFNRPERREPPQRPDIPPLPTIPQRDYEPDPVNGKPIENILTALAHRDSGKPLNFETALEQVLSGESLGPQEFVCYIGAGNFAVYEEVAEGGKKLLVQKKKIPYEDYHQKPQWRRELSPGISRDYIPKPETLDKLYSAEEERAFPKLGNSLAAYMPKNV